MTKIIFPSKNGNINTQEILDGKDEIVIQPFFCSECGKRMDEVTRWKITKYQIDTGEPYIKKYVLLCCPDFEDDMMSELSLSRHDRREFEI